MHVRGRGVARFAGVDDDDGSPLATQLQGCGEAGSRAADDGDVAMTFDGAVGVVTHAPNDRVIFDYCKPPCGIRKTLRRRPWPNWNRSNTSCALGCAACARPWACRSTSWLHAPTSAHRRSAGWRPANGRSASTSCCRSPAPSRWISTHCSTCSTTTTSSSGRRPPPPTGAPRGS